MKSRLLIALTSLGTILSGCAVVPPYDPYYPGAPPGAYYGYYGPPPVTGSIWIGGFGVSGGHHHHHNYWSGSRTHGWGGNSWSGGGGHWHGGGGHWHGGGFGAGMGGRPHGGHR